MEDASVAALAGDSSHSALGTVVFLGLELFTQPAYAGVEPLEQIRV